MPEDQCLLGLVHIQLGRAEQDVMVAGQVPTAAEQQIRLSKRQRQPEAEPLLRGHEIRLAPAVVITERLRPVRNEPADELPGIPAAFNTRSERPHHIELTCHARTISALRTQPSGTGTERTTRRCWCSRNSATFSLEHPLPKLGIKRSSSSPTKPERRAGGEVV